MAETYYEVLGVSPDASTEEITAAYRERVLETHPDHCDDPDAGEQFQQVATAESVLTDEVERRRYDRLGHVAYVSGSPYVRERPDPSEDPTAAAGQATQSEDASGPSHHARQRRRREWATREYWWDAEEHWTGRDRTTHTDTGGSEGGFTYDVHGWTDPVTIEEEIPSLEHSTLVAAGSICVTYPIFVVTALTPGLPLVINALVALCTLVLVGWILTIPRLAIPGFGGWSLIVTGVYVVAPPVDPFSLLGLVALACFWVPFGYAVAVWWAIRP